MPEQLSVIIARIQEWWRKYTKRQKAIIIGLAVFAVLVFAGMIVWFSRPTYATLITCDNTSQSSKVTDILTSANIAYDLSSNALVIRVNQKDLATAELALGAAGYVPDNYTLDDVLSSNLSTTASDTAKKYQFYRENQLRSALEQIEGIKSAKVNFNIPEQNGTLIASKEESSAYIQLETDGTFTSSQAASIAKATATFLGNPTTANITIIDSNGGLLFAGGDDYTTAGLANSMQELQNTAESYLANMVKKLIINTGEFDNAEITSHLKMDYASYEKTVKEYYSNSGRTEGMLSHEATYESESTSGIGGVPGTDSNGESTTYVTSDTSNSTSSSAETDRSYLPNESSVYSNIAAGSISYPDSSISITALSYKMINEKDVKLQGLLDGTTWDEYKLANSGRTKMSIDEDYYSLVSNATGIPVEKITILAYEYPIFNDAEGLQINWNTVLSALLIFLILGLLAFVILRSMGNRTPVEQEEEISVEDLLQSTPEPSVEDIDIETKSETRKMIEKFVDDNPEAAASLLRNWLSEDW